MADETITGAPATAKPGTPATAKPGAPAAAANKEDEVAGTIPAALLRLIRRPVPPKTAGGKETDRAVTREEVLSWKEYGDRVVVVTTDGQKLDGLKAQKG